MLRLVQRRVVGSLRSRTQCSRMMASETESSDSSSYDPGSRPRAEKGLNKVQLIGRVGRDPELKGSEDYPFYVFPLATNVTIRRANGEYNVKTDWHRIAVFRPGLRDNVANRVAKGDRLYLEGALSYMRYTDDEDRPTTITSIIANDIIFLDRRQNQNESDEHEDS